VLAVIAVLMMLVGAVSRCSGGTSVADNNDLMNEANDEMGNAIAAQIPDPPTALAQSSIRRGASHFETVFAAENFSGAMVYSQNCYDSLTHQFSWSKLDQCGAFDSLAVLALDASATAVPNVEQDYFASETAAGRYLAAATGARLADGEADTRLAEIQSRVERERVVAAPKAGSVEDREVEAPANDVQESNGLVDLPSSLNALVPAD